MNTAFALLVLPVAIVLRGLVLKAFGGWFVLPVFDTMPALGPMQSVGLAAAVSAFSGGGSDALRRKSIADAVCAKDQGMLEATIYAVAVPLLTLALGWVLQLFM